MVAGYLDQEPYSLAKNAAPSALVDRRPGYERARQLLAERWATEMLIAFSSRVAGAPAYQFEYMYSVLCFLLLYGPAVVYCRIWLKLRPIWAILTASTVCAGFWAQVTLDMRADGQQTATPLLLALALLTAHLFDAPSFRIRWRAYGLLALFAAGLVFCYAEILPMTVLGCAVFLVLYSPGTSAIGDKLRGYGFAAALAAAAALPMMGLLLIFIKGQISSAMSRPNNWFIAYFKWLYTDPITGIWGLGPLVAAWPVHLILLVPAALLTVALAISGLRALRPTSRSNSGTVLAASLMLAGGLQWVALCLRGQYWAGAKGLGYSYVFLTFTLVGFALPGFHRAGKSRRATLHRLVAWTAAGWLLVQCGLAVYRPWLALSKTDYANYIMGHGEYQRHDWNLRSLEAVLNAGRGLTVWSAVSNPWLSEYLGLVLGWKVHLVNIGASRDFAELGARKQSTAQVPQYLIAENGVLNGSLGIVAQNAEVSLVSLQQGVQVLEVSNPNGVEGPAKSPFYWLGGKPSVVKFLDMGATSVVLEARFTLGPSLPKLPYRDLLVSSNHSPQQRVVVRQGIQDIRIPAVQGLNEIVIEVEEKPAVLLPNDPRPLLLRMDQLAVRDAGCGQL
jgi:hypothetical protein